MAKGERWPELKYLYLERRLNVPTIAKLTGMAAPSIYSALRKMEVYVKDRNPPLSGRPPTVMNEDALKQMYLVEKRSLRDIAEELGVSHVTVHNALVKMGLARRRRAAPGAAPEHMAEMILLAHGSDPGALREIIGILQARLDAITG